MKYYYHIDRTIKQPLNIDASAQHWKYIEQYVGIKVHHIICKKKERVHSIICMFYQYDVDFKYLQILMLFPISQNIEEGFGESKVTRK